MKRFASALCILGIAGLWPGPLPAQTTPAASRASKIILDTDIGDDIDDAFALALALRSPEIEVIGITTAWGDTSLRAKLANRLVKDVGTRPIPVRAGVRTESKSNFTQNQWASGGAAAPVSPDAVEFLLEQARKSPGEITLIAIGPLTNIGAAIDRDADGFRKFQRVVLMGGSIRRGYGDLGYAPDRGPEPEYNIYCDVAAAQKLFVSGTPIFMMPLDPKQLQVDKQKGALLFRQGTPLTDALTLLYHEWGQQTPTLFD